MILVTHDPKVAGIGDRVLELRDGAIRGEIPNESVTDIKLTPSSSEEEKLPKRIPIPFPPKFCGSYGSNSIILPKMDSKTGMWTESGGQKTHIDLKFAQCANCGHVFWQPSKIEMT